jgi:DNA repair protein RadC
MGGQGSAFGLHHAQTLRFPLVGPAAGPCLGAPFSALTFAHPERVLKRAAPEITRHDVEKGTRFARALNMRVYEAKLVYSLVSLGEDVRLNNPATIADYLRPAFEENPMQEAFYCVYLDRKNHPLGRHLVSLGTVSNTLVHPREVFRGAILSGASALVVSHNHPSGDPAPSAADIQVTRQLREAAKVLDVILMDHVIVGDVNADPQGQGWYSFRATGLL